MDVAHATIALARAQEWVFGALIIRPADLALDLAHRIVSDSTFNFDLLLLSTLFLSLHRAVRLVKPERVLDGRVLRLKIIDVGSNVGRSEVPYQKFKPAHLDDVSLAHAVLAREASLLFSAGVGLHISNHNEHLVVLSGV